MKNLGILGTIVLLACSMQTANATPVTDQQIKLTAAPKWYLPYFDLGGYYSKLEPNEAGQANFFLPLLQNPNNLLYSSIRAYDKSGNPWEGNLAVGYRNLSLDQNNLWGVYGSYDRLRSQAQNYFNQATVGGEFWHQKWFAGANVYMPFGETRKADLDAQVTKLTKSDYQDYNYYTNVSNIYYGAGYERAMTGFDAEIGNNLWRGLTVYAGGYYFDAPHLKAVTGPRARATYTWYSGKHRILGIFDRIRVETEAQYDSPRGFDWYAGLRFTVNLFHKPDDLHGVAKHMVDPINRDLDVVTQSYHNPLQLLKNKDGSAVNVADVNTKEGLHNALNDDPKIDVIAVNGDISEVNNETIASGQDKYITGGNYSFNRDGQDFTVRVSQGGSLSADSDQNILNVSGAGNVVVRDLGLYVNPSDVDVMDNKAIYADDSFGNLLVDNINTNGRLVIDLDGAGKTGNVSVMNSYFNTDSWKGDGSAGTTGAVEFIAKEGANLTVGNFTDNIIVTKGDNAYGVYNYASYNSTLTFNGNFSNNRISTQGYMACGVDNYALYNSTLTFNGNFSDNHISDYANGVNGVKNHALVNSTLTFNGNFSDNHISNQGNFGFGVSNEAFFNSTLKFNDNFSGNYIYTRGNYEIGVYNYAGESTLIFNGNFSGNHISTQGDYADGVYNEAYDNGTLTFNGLSGNYITSAKADDFYFGTQTGGQINVYVSDPFGRGLSAANYGASINDYKSFGYNVNIYPGP
jgi:hypothetical protein